MRLLRIGYGKGKFQHWVLVRAALRPTISCQRRKGRGRAVDLVVGHRNANEKRCSRCRGKWIKGAFIVGNQFVGTNGVWWRIVCDSLNDKLVAVGSECCKTLIETSLQDRVEKNRRHPEQEEEKKKTNSISFYFLFRWFEECFWP